MKPLAGAGVLVTRPIEQAAELIREIEQRGGVAYALPVIEIVPRDPELVATDAAALAPADLFIFVSANAVRHGLDALPSDARIAAIGPATHAELSAADAVPAITPAAGGFNSEALLACPELSQVEGQTITIVRGSAGRELIARTLTERGAKVQYLAAYEREPRRFSASELEPIERAIRNDAMQSIVIMSVASLEALLDGLSDNLLTNARGISVVGISERVIIAARARLPNLSHVLARDPGATAIVDALVDAIAKAPAG